MILKVIYILFAIVGIIAIFYVSWFWRGLIGVMVAIILIDFASKHFKKKS